MARRKRRSTRKAFPMLDKLAAAAAIETAADASGGVNGNGNGNGKGDATTTSIRADRAKTRRKRREGIGNQDGPKASNTDAATASSEGINGGGNSGDLSSGNDDKHGQVVDESNLRPSNASFSINDASLMGFMGDEIHAEHFFDVHRTPRSREEQSASSSARLVEKKSSADNAIMVVSTSSVNDSTQEQTNQKSAGNDCKGYEDENKPMPPTESHGSRYMAGFKHITNFQRKGFVGDDVIAVSVPSRKELSATFDNDNVVMVSISRADDLMTNDLHGNVHGAVSVDGHLRQTGKDDPTTTAEISCVIEDEAGPIKNAIEIQGKYSASGNRTEALPSSLPTLAKKKAATDDENGMVSISTTDASANRDTSISVGIGHSDDAILTEVKDIGEGSSVGSSAICSLAPNEEVLVIKSATVNDNEMGSTYNFNDSTQEDTSMSTGLGHNKPFMVDDAILTAMLSQYLNNDNDTDTFAPTQVRLIKIPASDNDYAMVPTSHDSLQKDTSLTPDIDQETPLMANDTSFKSFDSSTDADILAPNQDRLVEKPATENEDAMVSMPTSDSSLQKDTSTTTSLNPSKSFINGDISLARATEIQERASIADIDTIALAPNLKGTVKESSTDNEHVVVSAPTTNGLAQKDTPIAAGPNHKKSFIRDNTSFINTTETGEQDFVGGNDNDTLTEGSSAICNGNGNVMVFACGTCGVNALMDKGIEVNNGSDCTSSTADGASPINVMENNGKAREELLVEEATTSGKQEQKDTPVSTIFDHNKSFLSSDASPTNRMEMDGKVCASDNGSVKFDASEDVLVDELPTDSNDVMVSTSTSDSSMRKDASTTDSFDHKKIFIGEDASLASATEIQPEAFIGDIDTGTLTRHKKTLVSDDVSPITELEGMAFVAESGEGLEEESAFYNCQGRATALNEEGAADLDTPFSTEFGCTKSPTSDEASPADVIEVEGNTIARDDDTGTYAGEYGLTDRLATNNDDVDDVTVSTSSTEKDTHISTGFGDKKAFTSDDASPLNVMRTEEIAFDNSDAIASASSGHSSTEKDTPMPTGLDKKETVDSDDSIPMRVMEKNRKTSVRVNFSDVLSESQEKSATNHESLMISTSSEDVTTQKTNPASDGAANNDDANLNDIMNTQGEADSGKASTPPRHVRQDNIDEGQVTSLSILPMDSHVREDVAIKCLHYFEQIRSIVNPQIFDDLVGIVSAFRSEQIFCVIFFVQQVMSLLDGQEGLVLAINACLPTIYQITASDIKVSSTSQHRTHSEEPDTTCPDPEEGTHLPRHKDNKQGNFSSSSVFDEDCQSYNYDSPNVMPRNTDEGPGYYAQLCDNKITPTKELPRNVDTSPADVTVANRKIIGVDNLTSALAPSQEDHACNDTEEKVKIQSLTKTSTRARDGMVPMSEAATFGLTKAQSRPRLVRKSAIDKGDASVSPSRQKDITTTTGLDQKEPNLAQWQNQATKTEQYNNEDGNSYSSSSSSDEDDSSDEEEQSDMNGSSNEDDNVGLSDYERLRLRNIKRNEKRLRLLGLLTKVSSGGATAIICRGSKRRSSALTNLLASDDNRTTTPGIRRQPGRQVSQKAWKALAPNKKLRSCSTRRSACSTANVSTRTGAASGHADRGMSDQTLGRTKGWSVKEDIELRKRVRIHGKGSWKEILDHSRILQKRYKNAPSVKHARWNIKDRWRQNAKYNDVEDYQSNGDGSEESEEDNVKEPTCMPTFNDNSTSATGIRRQSARHTIQKAEKALATNEHFRSSSRRPTGATVKDSTRTEATSGYADCGKSSGLVESEKWWSVGEDKELRNRVRVHGKGNWKEILDHSRILQERYKNAPSAKHARWNIKDRWRRNAKSNEDLQGEEERDTEDKKDDEDDLVAAASSGCKKCQNELDTGVKMKTFHHDFHCPRKAGNEGSAFLVEVAAMESREGGRTRKKGRDFEYNSSKHLTHGSANHAESFVRRSKRSKSAPELFVARPSKSGIGVKEEDEEISARATHGGAYIEIRKKVVCNDGKSDDDSASVTESKVGHIESSGEEIENDNDAVEDEESERKSDTEVPVSVKRRCKVWSAREDSELRKRVRIHGKGNWKEILDHSRILQERYKMNPSEKLGRESIRHRWSILSKFPAAIAQEDDTSISSNSDEVHSSGSIKSDDEAKNEHGEQTSEDESDGYESMGRIRVVKGKGSEDVMEYDSDITEDSYSIASSFSQIVTKKSPNDDIPRCDWVYMADMNRQSLLKAMCENKISADMTVIQISKRGATQKRVLQNLFLLVPDIIARGRWEGRIIPADSLFVMLQLNGIISMYDENGCQLANDNTSWDIYAKESDDCSFVNYWAIDHSGSLVGKAEIPKIGGVWKWFALLHHASEDRIKRADKASTTESQEKTNQTINDPIAGVHPADRPLLPTYLYLVLEQVEICHFTATNQVGDCNGMSIQPNGLVCKHCKTGTDCGFKCYPASEDELLSNVSNEIVEHIQSCKQCPFHIRDKLDSLQKSSASIVSKKARSLRSAKKRDDCGTKSDGEREFFQQLWWRLTRGNSKQVEDSGSIESGDEADNKHSECTSEDNGHWQVNDTIKTTVNATRELAYSAMALIQLIVVSESQLNNVHSDVIQENTEADTKISESSSVLGKRKSAEVVRRHGNMWSAKEDSELRKRVRIHGKGNWKAILENSHILQERYKMNPSEQNVKRCIKARWLILCNLHPNKAQDDDGSIQSKPDEVQGSGSIESEDDAQNEDSERMSKIKESGLTFEQQRTLRVAKSLVQNHQQPHLQNDEATKVDSNMIESSSVLGKTKSPVVFRMHGKAWSAKEDGELRKRVRIHGKGNWKAILENSHILQERYKMNPSEQNVQRCIKARWLILCYIYPSKAQDDDGSVPSNSDEVRGSRSIESEDEAENEDSEQTSEIKESGLTFEQQRTLRVTANTYPRPTPHLGVMFDAIPNPPALPIPMPSDLNTEPFVVVGRSPLGTHPNHTTLLPKKKRRRLGGSNQKGRRKRRCLVCMKYGGDNWSHLFSCKGRTGRGTCEHFELDGKRRENV